MWDRPSRVDRGPKGREERGRTKGYYPSRAVTPVRFQQQGALRRRPLLSLGRSVTDTHPYTPERRDTARIPPPSPVDDPGRYRTLTLRGLPFVALSAAVRHVPQQALAAVRYT